MRTSVRWAWAAGALVSVLCLVRVTYLVSRPEEAIAAVPDDAFYYLTLARNFAASGHWTFDQTTPTSGFQILHAYLLTVLDAALGNTPQSWVTMLALVGVGASLCLGVATALAIRAGQEANGGSAGWFALIAMVAPQTMTLCTMMMESHLVALGAAAVVRAVAGRAVPGNRRLVTIGVLGFLAALTRSDFLLLPLMLWLSCVAFARADVSRLRRSSIALLGALAGFGATCAHTLWISGTIFQTSARSKFRWSLEMVGITEKTAILLGIATVVLLIGALAVHKAGRSLGLMAEPVGAGCLATWVIFSVAFALMNPPVQAWYSASQLIPMALVLTSIGTLFGVRPRLLVVSALTSLTLALSILNFRTPLWPWQASMLQAAEKVRLNPAITHLGSWNAGILGFTSGKVVTNLDGLVDDSAAAAIERDDLLGYVHDRGIEYLVDYRDAALEPSPGMGFTGQDLDRCFQPVEVLDENARDPSRDPDPVVMFGLRPECR